nr:RHS repeat-associated core domain-containing protein [Yersinia pseudotuberculosis]
MQHFAYDDDNRLLRAWGTGPLGEHDSHYRYDALGRRIHKSVTIKRGAEKTTRQTDFIWQGLRLLQEQHADGNATYIYDPNESYTPLARVDQRHGETESQVYYFHTDINGTPLDVTDGEGKHRWSGKYHAWGKVTRQNVSDPRQSTVSRFAQPLRYPGQYSDDETGLHYNTFRYYDPEIGRFSTQDPIGLAGGVNLYQYGPNPLGWVDPWGLATYTSYEQARNAALKWLQDRGFKAETENLGRFGDIKGKPVGMQTGNGKVGFRVEFDERSGAHINTWSGKEKGPHFQFEASEKTVKKIQKGFDKKTNGRC